MIATLNGFDWFLILVLAISTFRAFSRGIIRVLFSIGGLVAGVLIACWNYLTVAEWLGRWVDSRQAAQILSFLLIVILVAAIFSLCAGLLRRTAKVVGLGALDRLLGAIFGLLRGCVIGVLMMTFLAAFLPNSVWVKNSHLAPYFLTGVHALSFVVPDQFHKQIAQGMAHLLHRAPDYMKPHTLEWKHSN